MATNDIVDAAYLKQRRFDRKTKELIFTVSLMVMGASKEHIQSHVRVALDLGVPKGEILWRLSKSRRPRRVSSPFGTGSTPGGRR